MDLFELTSPEDLFHEIQKAILEYHKQPTSRLLLFLIFSLNHLREWIAETSYEKINKKHKVGLPLSNKEEFYCKLWELNEFRIINHLCNRSKHYKSTSDISTSITKGATVISPVSDSLGQEYYRINGVDSRDIFAPVIREYNQWFKKIN